MKRRLFWWCLALCILWTLFIFSRSAKSGAESSAESGAALALLDRLMDFLRISWLPSEHFVRKAGHFTEYFILGVFALPSARRLLCRTAPLAACGYAAAIALLDEFLVQNLSAGRGPSFSDVLIDLAGASAAILFLLGLSWIGKRKLKF